MAEKLTPRERKFVTNLLAGMKKRDSAKAAGYAPNSAHVAATTLLKRDRVLRAIREGAERQLQAGLAIGAATLAELAENANSEDVRLRAAQALLDRGGLPLVRQSEHRHVIEDQRSDSELLEHVRRLSAELRVPLPAEIIDVQAEPVPALPAPTPNIFD